MCAEVISLHGKVRSRTLERLKELLYGTFRSCDPGVTLAYASRAIGRKLRHRDVSGGLVSEREALLILDRVAPLFPDRRAATVRWVVRRYTP